MVQVRLRYWAGVKAAAGRELDTVEAASLADALAEAGRRHGSEFVRALSVSSVLVAGRAVDQATRSAPLEDDVEAEVLPPFAGG